MENLIKLLLVATLAIFLISTISGLIFWMLKKVLFLAIGAAAVLYLYRSLTGDQKHGRIS